MNENQNSKNHSEFPFRDENFSVEERIEDLLKRLTIKEKFKLLTGRHQWETKPIKRLGIEPFLMTDGPHGVAPHSSGGRECTYFPVGICRAATWNPSLSFEFGKALAEEVREIGAHMILGPGVNIDRTPLCGRTFEYQTEDPYLNKKLALPVIKGVQGERIAACVKHYICNNQEKNRYTYSAVVSQRALEEIYFPAFKAAVKEADVWSVMGSYNKINGIYGCAHEELIKRNLMEKWGFRGFVVSDWNATHNIENVEDCVKAGLSLEMPRAKIYKRRYLEEAFSKGLFEERDLDEDIKRLLRVMFLVGIFDKKESLPLGCRNTAEHKNISRKIAEEGIVLLKNEGGLLPLDANKIKTISIKGSNADREFAKGGGSSAVKPPYEITPFEGIRQKIARNIKVIDDESQADVVVLVLGLNHEENNDIENWDRNSLELPQNQLNLIDQVAKQNEKIIIVLINGSPITMDNWIDKVDAIIEAWYPGQEGGKVIADIIFGDVNPSGKLPLTFPKRLEDSPAHISEKRYPSNKKVIYDEGIFVGYRYFDKYSIEPLFPFGFGLSYTSFKYTNLNISKNQIKDTEELEISLEIENIGDKSGAEIIQLYIQEINPKVERPLKELKRFKKVFLTSRNNKEINFGINKDDLAYFDEELNSWNTNEGKYNILIGSSSRDIKLQKSFEYKK
ncbi:MAG: beta-glucosidase [Promethearchaeati archaeon]